MKTGYATHRTLRSPAFFRPEKTARNYPICAPQTPY